MTQYLSFINLNEKFYFINKIKMDSNIYDSYDKEFIILLSGKYSLFTY